jgi:lipopolysaccharide biosynthesis glycosyltransferase
VSAAPAPPAASPTATSPAASSPPTGPLLRTVFATDAKFFLGLLVSACSLAASLDPAVALEVHLLDGGLSDAQWQRFQRLLRRWRPATRFQRHPVSHFPLERYSRRHPVGAMTMARLYIPELLASEAAGADRVLYVDVDMLVLADLAPLLRVDLQGHPCACVLDAPGAVLQNDCPFDWAAAGLAGQEPYFNAGLLLIDLPTWRRQRVSERCLDLIEASDCHLPNGDQTVINFVLVNDWCPLPGGFRYNALHTHFRCPQLDDPEQRPAILHYKGGTKPWHCFEPDRDAFLAWYAFAFWTVGLPPWRLGSLVWLPWLKGLPAQLLRPSPSRRAGRLRLRHHWRRLRQAQAPQALRPGARP